MKTVIILAITFFSNGICFSDEGQTFLNERLPHWKKMIDSKNDFGCLRFQLFQEGKVFTQGLINSKENFRISERIHQDKSRTVDLANDRYSATIRIKNEAKHLYRIGESSVDSWDHPFLMTSFHDKNIYPDRIRKQEMIFDKYSVKDGMHHFLFLGDGDVFESTELVFDEIHPMPIEITNRFAKAKGEGQTARFKKFTTVGETSLPTEIEIKNFFQNDPSIFAKYEIEFSSESLDTTKCYLEHYGLSAPGYEVAKKTKRTNLWIYVGGLMILIVGGMYLANKRSRK